jgi:DnaA-homolog protein
MARIGARQSRIFKNDPTLRPRPTFPSVQRQLTLDLGTPPPATFDNFFAASNHELVTRLRELEGALAAGPVADRTFYIWGEPGSGRSHLLHALVHEAGDRARFLGPQSALNAFNFDPRVTLYAVDDCDRLSAAQQIALFNLFNEVRATPASALVATGNDAPLALNVREDLRTRLGWGLVFHLQPLSDEAKAAVLKHAAHERGLVLADDVPAYLLTHFRRDMPSLMALFDDLDRFSLERKRAVSTNLMKKMLQTRSATFPADQTDAAASTGLFDDSLTTSRDLPAPDNAPTRFK